MRNIWIADVANHGKSGIVNEGKLGNIAGLYSSTPRKALIIVLGKACSTDHARDLLHLINHFRKDMPRPLVGIGHR